MKVGERMTKNPQTVSPAETLANTQERMHGGGFRQMPVVDNEKLIGIITDRDIRKHGRHMIVAKVQTAMTDKVLTVSPATALEEAARLLVEHKIGGLPVVEKDKLVGIITTSDVMRAYIDLVASAGKS